MCAVPALAQRNRLGISMFERLTESRLPQVMLRSEGCFNRWHSTPATKHHFVETIPSPITASMRKAELSSAELSSAENVEGGAPR